MNDNLTKFKNEFAIIKTWMKKIYSYHKQEPNKENLIEIKKLLVVGQNREYFTFLTEKKEIKITFKYGEVKISQKNGFLNVFVDEITKKRVNDFKDKIKDLEGSQLESKKESKTHETCKENQDEIDLKKDNEVEINNEPKDPLFKELALFSEETYWNMCLRTCFFYKINKMKKRYKIY